MEYASGVIMVMVVLQLEEEREAGKELPMAHWAMAVTVVREVWNLVPMELVVVVEVVTMEEVDHLGVMRRSVVVEVILFDCNNIFYITRIYICIPSCDRWIKLYRRM